MKRTLYILPLLAMILCSCHEQVANITISQSVLQMVVGDTYLLEVAGSTGAVEWISSDEEVATVYGGGVTAKAIGNAIITAKVGEAKAECAVYVKGGDGATLRLSPAFVNMEKGDTVRLRCGNTMGFDLQWSSSNEAAVTVDQTGLCTAVGPGNALITVKTPAEEVSAVLAVKHNWGEHVLVWSEEFEGTELNSDIWNIEVNGNGGGNQEKQYYTDRTENVRVKDGCLELEVRKEDYQDKQYTSGRINSRRKKDFLYGRIEARIKFPGGTGTWPAFWMLGSAMDNGVGWPKCGEIDIIEHIGKLDSRASFALHTYAQNGSRGNNWASTYFFNYPLSNDFHVYGIEWLQEQENGRDEIHFYVDGQEYAMQREVAVDDINTWPFNKPQYIILNLAVGGSMGGSIDDAIFSEERIMYVDWVRVYQRQEK